MTRATAVGFAAAFLLAGCGGSASKPSTAPDTEAVKDALVARLQSKRLSYRWIVCVGAGRSYKGVPITRCNVNFGIDPHVEAYCLLLKDGELVTNHDDGAIPCKHDDAGWDATTITSS